MAGLKKRDAKSSASRVRQHRERMRKLGLKPVTMWLPDVNDPKYIAECRRQALLTRSDPHEAEYQAWVEAAVADIDWPPFDWGPEGSPPGIDPWAPAPDQAPRQE